MPAFPLTLPVLEAMDKDGLKGLPARRLGVQGVSEDATRANLIDAMWAVTEGARSPHQRPRKRLPPKPAPKPSGTDSGDDDSDDGADGEADEDARTKARKTDVVREERAATALTEAGAPPPLVRRKRRPRDDASLAGANAACSLVSKSQSTLLTTRWRSCVHSRRKSNASASTSPCSICTPRITKTPTAQFIDPRPLSKGEALSVERWPENPWRYFAAARTHLLAARTAGAKTDIERTFDRIQTLVPDVGNPDSRQGIADLLNDAADRTRKPHIVKKLARRHEMDDADDEVYDHHEYVKELEKCEKSGKGGKQRRWQDYNQGWSGRGRGKKGGGRGGYYY